MAMMLASVLAVIPVSATGSIDTSDSVVMNDGASTEPEDKVETTRFLSEEAYEALKAHYEGSEINANVYSPGAGPFVIVKSEGRAKFANKRILSISLPVESTGNVDGNGDLQFTITVFKVSALNSTEAPVATHVLKFNAEKYGLEGNQSNIHKFITFDLTDANIVVGEGEVIGLAKGGDTLLPAWNGNGIKDLLESNGAGYAVGFGAYAGTTTYDGNTWPDSCIYFDVEMVDATAGKPIYDADDFAAIANDGTYYLANDITLPEGWEAKAISGVTLNGNYKTITLAGANGLFGDVTNSTVKNFTLAGGTTTTGVGKNANGVTYKNITVDLTKIEGSGSVGAFVTESTGDVTIYNCTNNAEITGGEVGGAIGKQLAGEGKKIDVDKFYNNGNLTGSNTAGAITGWHAASGVVTVDDSVNTGNTSAKYCGGFIGANYSGGGTTLTNCVNGAEDKTVTVTCSNQGAGGFVGSSNNPLTLVNCKNYAAVTAAEKGAGGLVGNASANTTVTNCENHGTVNLTNNGYNWGAAGAVGDYSSATLTVNGFENTAKITTFCASGAVTGWDHSGKLDVKNVKNSGEISAKYAGGLVGAKHGGSHSTFENCENTGKIASQGSYAGGFFGEFGQSVALVNCSNKGQVGGADKTGGIAGSFTAAVTMTKVTNTASLTSGTMVGGFFALKGASGDLVMTDCVNSGSVTMTANNNHAGIGAKVEASKVVLRNVYNTGSVTKTGGGWNNGNGGFFGHTTSGSYYFTDCANTGNATGGSDNKGGFIGYYAGSKTYFKNSYNTGDVSGTGNNGGFLGQGSGSAYFENCYNSGNITSSSNTTGGFMGWCEGATNVTIINCVNTGNLNSPHQDKWSAGFCCNLFGGNAYVYGAANYGSITAGNYAAGLMTNPNKVTIEKSFNAGVISAKTVSSITNADAANTTIIDCIDAGNHKNILDRLALLSPATYETMVEQDKWDDLKDVVAAAKAVYDNSESTNADKRAIIANLEAVIDDINTYVDSEAGANFNDPSLKINVSVADGKTGDYVALVKDGDTDATIKVLVKNITADFDILAVDPEEGKAITAGTYKLYLLRGDVEVADAVADETLALAVKAGIIVDVNVIKTAEQFMAMTNGNYILGNDVAVAGGIENFTGKLDGMGNTVFLTGTKGIFKTASGVTLKNFNVEAAYADNTLFDAGVIFTATGNITIDNVHLGSFDIKNGDRVGGFINSIEDNNAVISITNVTTKANIYGVWIGAGIIGRAYVKSITLENVVNNASVVSSTIVHTSTNFGTGGLLCDITTTDFLKIKNVANHADLVAAKAKVGGIVALAGGNISIENAINTGNVTYTNTEAVPATGGIIGFVRSASTITITDCENTGDFPANANTNKGGIIGRINADSTVTLTRCINRGDMLSDNGNANGGLIGQSEKATVKIVDSANYGKVTSTWLAGGLAAYVKSIEVYNSFNYGEVIGGTAAGIVVGVQSNGAITIACCEEHKTAAAGASDKTKIEHCDDKSVANYGNVKGSTAVGLYTGSGAGSGTVYVINAVNNGNVTATDGKAAGFGHNVVSVNHYYVDCVNNGTITATNDAVGGMGDTYGDNLWFINFENNGKITSTGGNASGVTLSASWTTKFINCTNDGDVVANGNAVGFGYSGNGPRTYQNCVNNGNITSATECAAGIFMSTAELQKQAYTVTDCVNNGTITGGKNAGGIATNLAGNTQTDGNFKVTFTRCINNGEVTSTSTSKYQCVAGIVGYFDGVNEANFIECVNNADIIFTVGDASGIAGWGGSTAPLTFKDCENYGVIYGKGSYQITSSYGMTNKTFEGTQVEEGHIYKEYLNNPTPIWTADDFMNMRAGGVYILMDNIILPEDYASIAFGSEYFTSIINGNGKIIYMKGLTCPLFSELVNAEISNLTIVGSISGDAAVAVIAKTATGNVTINNVVVDVDINTTTTAAVGGFIGRSGANNISLTISNSKFLGSIDTLGYAGGFVGFYGTSGPITVTNSNVGDAALNTHINGVNRVAGFFGKIQGPKNINSTDMTATFTNCKNFATISQVNTGAEGVAGGIIGRAQHITVVLDGVENYGDVSTVRPTLGWPQGAGGLVGELNSNGYLTILSSANYGDITTDKGQIGGLVGLLSCNSYLTIGALEGEAVDTSKASYNFGNVIVPANSNVFSGGILGGVYNGTVDTNNLVAGSVLNSTKNTVKIYGVVNYGNVTGGYWANLGGIMGGQNDGQAAESIEIIGAANYGTVHSTTSNVGGILGQVYTATDLKIIDCANYGYIKSESANGAAGIVAYTWGGAPKNYVIDGCVNYGTIENAGTGTAAGIASAPNATDSIVITNNTNYGTVFAGGKTAGIVIGIYEKTTFSNNTNYGIVINGQQLYAEARANTVITPDNVAAGAVIADSELAKIAKTINAADYMLADLIGIENTAAGSVDPTALTFSAYDDEGVVADFEYYYVLNVDDEAITSDATVEGDFAGHSAILARSYAAKLARVSSNTEYVLTFNAKTTGADAGFVYAISPAGTVKTYLTAMEEGMILDGDYAQFKVEYNGLIATISVLADGANGDEWVVLHEALLEDGAYAAIGIANGASETTGEGEDLVTFADTKQVASVADIAFSNTYRVGGIINAFRALDTLAIELSDASFEADALAAALADATAAETNALAEVEAARLAVEAATKALNDAVAAGQRESELDDEMATLEEAIARHDQAKRDEHLIKKALDNVTANEAKAAAAYKAVSESYAEDYAEAVEDIVDAIDGAINYGGYVDAVIALMKLGVKVIAKYDQEVIEAINGALNAAMDATTQAELDAQVEIINSYINALDWAEYNYWKNVMNSLNEVDYTIFSWATFAEFKATVAEKEATLETQEQIDMMTAEIITNIEALKDDIYQAAELQEYLDKAIAYRDYWNAEEENENYTANSWADFYNAIIKPFQDAIDAVDPDLDNDGVLEYAYDGAQFNDLESDLIAKYNAFKAAYEKTDAENNIILVAVINDLYNTAKDAIDGTGEKEYSDITKLYLLAAIPEAEKIYAKIAEADAARDYAAAQKAVEDAIDVYAPVVNALADVTELKATIAEQADALAEADTEYTAETWNAYELALAKAEFTVVTAKSDEEVAEALAELIAAYDALVEFVAVDTDTLIGAIASAEALNKANYTASSWADLREAILEAKLAILADDQTVIDAAYAALADAIADLVLVPDTDALKALVGEASALNATEYTAETWLEFALALQNAKAALKSDAQKDVNDAKDALAAAKAALVKKAAADNSALKTLIAEVEALKEADYTADTWASLKTALEAAKAALDSDKQTDIDVAKATLAAAKAGLDKVVVENEAEEAPKTEDNTQTTEEKKGCKSAIGATVVVMTAVLGLGATVVLKKKED